MEVNGGQEVLVKQLFTFFMLGQNQSIKSTHTCCFEGLVSASLLLVSFLLLEKNIAASYPDCHHFCVLNPIIRW